jgi:hypothetical protein
MKELINEYVGKEAVVVLGGLDVKVNIVDVKFSWGNKRFQVEPVYGNGRVWVERVELLDNKK